jgi:hypothetical protein
MGRTVLSEANPWERAVQGNEWVEWSWLLRTPLAPGCRRQAAAAAMTTTAFTCNGSGVPQPYTCNGLCAAGQRLTWLRMFLMKVLSPDTGQVPAETNRIEIRQKWLQVPR